MKNLYELGRTEISLTVIEFKKNHLINYLKIKLKLLSYYFYDMI